MCVTHSKEFSGAVSHFEARDTKKVTLRNPLLPLKS
jgi:hypothetical protein